MTAPAHPTPQPTPARPTQATPAHDQPKRSLVAPSPATADTVRLLRRVRGDRS